MAKKKNKERIKRCRYDDDEILIVKKNIKKSEFKNYSDFVRFYTLSSLDNVYVKVDENKNNDVLDLRSLVVAINRLNNNLNQIAKQVNTHSDKIDKIKYEILSSINKIKDDSNELKKEYLK